MRTGPVWAWTAPAHASAINAAAAALEEVRTLWMKALRAPAIA
jgi:hypothetical protein